MDEETAKRITDLHDDLRRRYWTAAMVEPVYLKVRAAFPELF